MIANKMELAQEVAARLAEIYDVAVGVGIRPGTVDELAMYAYVEDSEREKMMPKTFEEYDVVTNIMGQVYVGQGVR